MVRINLPFIKPKLFKQNEKKETFDCFGPVLGHIVSRVTDPVIQIRTIAMDCIENLIRALQIYSQVESNDNEKQAEYLNAIKQKLVKTDSNVLLSAVSELAKVKITDSNFLFNLINFFFEQNF